MINISCEEDIESIDLNKGSLYLKQIEDTVKKIVDDVRKNGDEALFSYTKKFDNFNISCENMMVSEDEIEKAVQLIPDEEKEVMEYAKARIEKFHSAAKQKSFFIEEDGIILGNRVTPCQSCGLYVPGGKAAYPSTALMTIVPAVVAGVKDISIATPAQNGYVNPYVLFAAHICSIKKIYKIGGAQSIAALAYSTESIKGVDVIAGPGNIYVALAKKAVFGDVAIDSVAGPSEIAIVADKDTNIEFAANDLLSQAEHDEMAGCYFVGLDKDVVKNTEKRFFELAQKAEKKDITLESSKNAMFFYVDDIKLAARLIDKIAPEHLEIQLRDPYEFMNMVNNAGAMFLGEYTPEPIGDYIAGPNHTLPTNRTARFASPLSSDVFMKKSSIIHYSKEAFFKSAKYASKFAQMEGLFAHKASIEVRLDGDS